MEATRKALYNFSDVESLTTHAQRTDDERVGLVSRPGCVVGTNIDSYGSPVMFVAVAADS